MNSLYLFFVSLFFGNNQTENHRTLEVTAPVVQKASQLQANHEIISLETVANNTEYKELSPEQIYVQLYQENILKAQHISIIKFFMPNCGECLSVKLPYQKLAQKMSGIAFYDANCDSVRLEAIADGLEIEKVPAFVIVQKGKELGRFFGQYSYTDLQKEVDKIISIINLTN